MKAEDRDPVHLHDVLECGRRALDYALEGKETFLARGMATDAILRNLEVMGEAVKRLSPALRDEHPDLPWRRVAGMRDVLIHAYDHLDLPSLWDVLEDDLPSFLEGIEQIRSARGWP